MASFETYGSIIKKKTGSYQINFWNPVEKKNYYAGSADNIEDAERKLGDAQFDFFSKHKYLVPKGISLDNRRRRFEYYITIVRELSKTDTYFISSHVTMEGAVKAKKEFIANLI